MITTCHTCGHAYHWHWEDAFDKFGFDDGDGQVMTDAVANVLRTADYEVDAQPWGLHNIVITSICRSGVEQIPASAEVGYDDPRTYLPAEIVALLDTKLADTAEVEP